MAPQRRITDLSDEILLLIFDYLDPSTLLSVAQVCKTWNRVSEDPIFWQRQMEKMRHHCKFFCHCNSKKRVGGEHNPAKRQFYKMIMTEKDGICKNGHPSTFELTAPIGSTSPKILMFGPGLDSSGSQLVYDLMWGEKSPFKTVGMFPNSHSAVGGGVLLKYKNHDIQLITLYRATKKEREALSAAMGPRKNRIIDSEFMLENSKVVASSVDAFIYVCDRIVPLEEEIRREFEVLTETGPQPAPILLIMPESEQGTQTCADYVTYLNLTNQKRRWWLYSLDVHKELNLFEKGLDWMLHSINSPSSSQQGSSFFSSLPSLRSFNLPSIF